MAHPYTCGFHSRWEFQFAVSTENPKDVNSRVSRAIVKTSNIRVKEITLARIGSGGPKRLPVRGTRLMTYHAFLVGLSIYRYHIYIVRRHFLGKIVGKIIACILRHSSIGLIPDRIWSCADEWRGLNAFLGCIHMMSYACCAQARNW